MDNATQKLTGLADTVRGVSGVSGKLGIDSVKSIIQGLNKANLVQKADDQWHHMNGYNIAIATLPVDYGATYSASLEVKNVLNGGAGIMYVFEDKDNNFLDPSTGQVTTQLGNALRLLTSDSWSKDNVVHTGSFTVNNKATKYVQIRAAGNANISVDYRKLMVNVGPLALPYTSKYLLGGGN